MKSMLAKISCVLVFSTVASAQTAPNRNQPDSKRFRGCLQGDSIKGFSLLAATGDASGGDDKGQTMTYKVEAPLTINLAQHVNKVVEITGVVSQEAGKTGSMPAPVPDTVRGTGGAGGTGKPGENSAFYFANGTLNAKTIKEVAQTCAVRSAPDTDRKPQ